MDERLEGILELPNTAKAGIAVGTVVVLLGLYYFAFYASLGDEMTFVEEDISKLELEIAEKKGIAANLPRFTEEVARLDIELVKALKELPDKKSIEQLLARVSDKVRDAGLEIRLFQPMPEQRKDFYAEIPVEIQVSGTYHQVATFFDEVGHLSRIVNVNQFILKEPTVKENDVLLNTSVVATSYRFLEESERPKDDVKKKKRRRRS
jgi:type IV pilus assembly protein PilO